MSLLSVSSLSKDFGAINALQDVSLKLEKGSVLGLMGDNGAGKSTLLKIVAGNFRPSSGSISVDDKKVTFDQPRDARRAGIEAVYQDLALCGNLTAAENIFLGREIGLGAGPFKFLNKRSMNLKSRELLNRLKSDTREKDLVSNFSGGQRQAVAIARSLLSDPKIVLMDEPLAAISVKQVKEVLQLIDELREGGVAVILVSHRLPDIFAVADRIAVLRRGVLVGDKPISESSPEEVTGLITGAVDEAF